MTRSPKSTRRTIVHFMFLLMTLAAMLAGCAKKKDVVGRWTTSNKGVSYYFRADGMLFYKASNGRKYQGVYSVDKSTSPMTIRSQLRAMDGGMDSMDLEFKASFVTADRLQLESPTGRGTRKQLLGRVTEEEVAKQKDQPPTKKRGPVRLRGR